MIRLSTTQKLQAVLGGAVATTNPVVVACHSTATSNAYAGATTLTNMNGATAVDIVSAPVDGYRDVDYISINNRDTADVTVTVMIDTSSVDTNIITVTLNSGDRLEYTHSNGWKTLDSFGSTKTVLTLPADTEYIDFIPTTAPAFQEGRLYYDNNVKALTYYNDISNSSMQLGFEQWVRVRNTTGSTIPDGSVVYINGASGQTPTVALADADIVSPHQVLGIATADIANNAQGHITTHGIVNNQNTSGFADGTTLYLSTTAGQLTDTPPTGAAAVIAIGTVAYSHAANGKIYVSVDDAQEYLTGNAADGKVNKTGVGFDEATGDYDTTLTYNETTRTITIAPTGASFDVYIQGEKFSKTSQSLAHTDVDGGHFFYFDQTGTFVVSQTPWDILLHAPVAYVFWDATNNRGMPFEERHHAGRDIFWHRNQHFAEGTKATSGFAISGYTEDDGSTDAAVTFSIASGRLEDEDIRVVTASLPDNGPYTILERVGASGTWQITRASVLPYLYSGNNLQYNQYTGATWQRTNVPEDNFVNYWVFGLTTMPLADIAGKVDASMTTQQIVIVAGQTVHASEALASAESVSAIQWGSIPFQEICPLYQITLRYNATAPIAYTNTTRTAIVRAVRIVGTAATITQTAQSDHGALAGLLDDDHPQYQKVSEKGVADGYASLDSGGKVPAAQLPSTGGLSAWSIKTSGYTAVTGDRLMCNTTSASFTVTLPATPSANDRVIVSDYAGTFATNKLTIGRNGSKIMSLTEDMDVTTNNVTLTLEYIDATQGWRIV